MSYELAKLQQECARLRRTEATELASLRQRCDALEKQVADLAAGKPSPASESRPTDARRLVERRSVTITRLPDRNPSFVMPSDDELRRLYEIVIARYPRLAARSEQAEEALDGFRRAFLRIAHLGRDKLNSKYMLTSWVDDAKAWMRDHEVYPSFLTGRDFVCAVLAHGDVDYVPLDRFPYDCSAFGLRRDSTGRPASDGWRSVLNTGRLRAPVPHPTVTRSPLQIAERGGG